MFTDNQEVKENWIDSCHAPTTIEQDMERYGGDLARELQDQPPADGQEAKAAAEAEAAVLAKKDRFKRIQETVELIHRCIALCVWAITMTCGDKAKKVLSGLPTGLTDPFHMMTKLKQVFGITTQEDITRTLLSYINRRLSSVREMRTHITEMEASTDRLARLQCTLPGPVIVALLYNSVSAVPKLSRLSTRSTQQNARSRRNSLNHPY